jgi:ABC-type nitrate/sulfonate/bicarbonate transport system substrate-binding protein
MKRPIETLRPTRRTAMLMALGMASASPQVAAQSRSIAIGYQEQPDWLMFVARDQKLLEKVGLSPSFVKFPGGTPMIEAASTSRVSGRWRCCWVFRRASTGR